MLHYRVSHFSLFVANFFDAKFILKIYSQLKFLWSFGTFWKYSDPPKWQWKYQKQFLAFLVKEWFKNTSHYIFWQKRLKISQVGVNTHIKYILLFAKIFPSKLFELWKRIIGFIKNIFDDIFLSLSFSILVKFNAL